jgi:hypothetical protein
MLYQLATAIQFAVAGPRRARSRRRQADDSACVCYRDRRALCMSETNGRTLNQPSPLRSRRAAERRLSHREADTTGGRGSGGRENRSGSVKTAEHPAQVRSADRYKVPSWRRTVTCSKASQEQTRQWNGMTVCLYSLYSKEKRGYPRGQATPLQHRIIRGGDVDPAISRLLRREKVQWRIGFCLPNP